MRGFQGGMAQHKQQKENRGRDMRHIFKLLVVLVVLAGIGLIGFAYVGDLSPDQSLTTQPVTLDVQ